MAKSIWDRLSKQERARYNDLMNAVVKRDVRICFSLVWFKTEEEAEDLGRLHDILGITVNGGWLHGMICGRSPEFDYVDKETGDQLFACRE